MKTFLKVLTDIFCIIVRIFTIYMLLSPIKKLTRCDCDTKFVRKCENPNKTITCNAGNTPYLFFFVIANLDWCRTNGDFQVLIVSFLVKNVCNFEISNGKISNKNVENI